MGDDDSAYSTSNTIVVGAFYDGGSFTWLPEYGRFITVRRDSTGPDGNDLHLSALKVYQVPDLLQASGITAVITADTSTSVSGYEAINLIQNLQNRSSGNDQYALIASTNPKTTLGQHTCYKVAYAQMIGGKIIIGIKFSELVFIHAIIHA